MYLKSFEYFRGITIILIVVGHCYGIAGWVGTSFWDKTLINLISGGTSLFVFISGFLFHHVFYPKFQYRKFILKKFKNVYVPFLILSILPVCLALYQRQPFVEFYFGPTDSFYDNFLRPIFMYYWYGGVLVYWYIPFIMTMFLISPVFIKFVHLRKNIKIILICVLSVVSVLMQRPVNNWSILQSVVYFSPVYLFGIFCSMEREHIYKVFRRKEWILFAGIVLLAMVQAWLVDYCSTPAKEPFAWGGIDISYVQKMLLCVFLMVFLHRFENREWKILNHLAVSSFSIYFLHGWIIQILSWMRPLYRQWSGLHLVFILSPLVIWLSYVAARSIRRRFPEKSRMIIGW